MNAHENVSVEEQKALAVVCIWEGTSRAADFFALNKMLYHLVARCCEASAQKKSKLNIFIKEEGNRKIPCLAFNVERHKTSHFQDILVFSHKSTFLQCLYFSLAYKLVMDSGDFDYFFPDYADRLGKDESNKIDSRTGNLFSDYYKILTSLSQKYDEPVLIHDEEMSKCCIIIQFFFIYKCCIIKQFFHFDCCILMHLFSFDCTRHTIESRKDLPFHGKKNRCQQISRF